MYEIRDGRHIVEETVTIDRAPGEVFRFLTTPENIPLFWSNMIDYEHRSTPLEKGTHARAVLRVAGRKMAWTAELVEMVPDRHLAWRSVEAPFAFEYEYRLEPAASGTTVTYRMEAGELGGFFGKIAELLVGRMFARDVRTNLEHLKELMEADVTGR